MKYTRVKELIESYISKDFYELVKDFEDLHWTEEIRIRNKSPIFFKILGEKYYLTNTGLSPDSANSILANDRLMGEIFNRVTDYSLHAFNEEIKNGYITLREGHRVGLSGQVVMENGEILTIKNICSYNFRVAKEVLDCSLPIMDIIGKNFGHTLIFGPPSSGKTTVLKDMLKKLSNKYNISVCDERGELTMDYSPNIDVLKNCPKSTGMMTLLRSMSPEVICVDEIGKADDVLAIEEIINCGVIVLASIHGKNIDELREKLYVGQLVTRGFFKYYVELGRPLGKYLKVYDKNMERIF